MKTIWEYRLMAKPGPGTMPMPAGSVALSAQLQGEDLMLWMEIDYEQPEVIRRFYIVFTGFDSDFMHGIEKDFIDTVIMPNGIVLHVYIEREEKQDGES